MIAPARTAMDGGLAHLAPGMIPAIRDRLPCSRAIAHAAQFRHHLFMAGTSERWGAWWRASRGVEAPLAVWKFRVERQRGAVGRLHDSLEEKLPGQVPEAALRALQVALDELLTNVIMHAEQAAGPVEVEIAHASNALDIRISYLADQFDPTSWRPPQRGTSIEAARIGGLGIELVRMLMDEFCYEYADGCNVLTLRKRLLRAGTRDE